MVERGDWLIPQFQDQPFADKPPLFFWAQAVSLCIFGMHDWAVRLPGMLFAVAGILTTALLARRLFDRQTAVVAGLFQATTILPLALAQAAVHDVALVPFTNLAILCLLGAVHAVRKRSYFVWLMLAGLTLGLACLTKGLMGLACVGIVVGGYLLASPRREWWHLFSLALAIIVGCVVAAPWFVLMEQRAPGYFYYYVVQRHFLGYLTESQRHGSAKWWYYLPVLFGGGLPWISYLPAHCIDGWDNWRRGNRRLFDSHHKLLWIWAIGWTMFVCAGQSKLVTYLLPVFPALSILAAVAWVRYSRDELSRRAQSFMCANFRLTTRTTPLLMPIVWLIVCQKFPLQVSWPVVLVTCLAGLSPWLVQWHGCSRNLLDTFGRASVVLVISFLCVISTIVPQLAEFRTARGLAARFNAEGLPSQLLLAQDRFGSFVFYLNPELRAQVSRLRVQSWPVRHWDEQPVRDNGAIVAVPETMADNAEDRYAIEGLPFQQVGTYRLYNAASVQCHVANRDVGPLRR
jgi:hypothetical protein